MIGLKNIGLAFFFVVAIMTNLSTFQFANIRIFLYLFVQICNSCKFRKLHWAFLFIRSLDFAVVVKDCFRWI